MARVPTIAENIQAIVELEEGRERKRPFSDRIADAIGSFVGTVVFVLAHLLWFSLWASINMGVMGVMGVLGRPFDPYPFPLLCMLVSLEGVLLSTFVLIRQNRMSTRAERRSHLDLQINLLTEKEVSKVIQMLERISERLELPVDGEAQELGQTTAVLDLARELDQRLPDER